jgi:hypothetical protein
MTELNISVIHSRVKRRLFGNRKRPRFATGPSKIIPGGVLLSHFVSEAVPSALEGLTAVFEMGTGVTPPPSPPGNF